VLALTFSYFAFGYVAWIFFAWFYIYMAQVRGLNLKTSALYSMLPFIAMTIGCLGGGVVSDWIARRFSLRLGRCLLPGLSLADSGIAGAGVSCTQRSRCRLDTRLRRRRPLYRAERLLGCLRRTSPANTSASSPGL
jgi:MFS family permease